MTCKYQPPHFDVKTIFSRYRVLYRVSHYKDKRIMGIFILVRRHLYIEKSPWSFKMCKFMECIIIICVDVDLHDHPWYVQFCCGSMEIYLYFLWFITSNMEHAVEILPYTVKPVCNLYNEIYHLWVIQWCILMMIECTNLLGLTISAFWSSSTWPLAT